MCEAGIMTLSRFLMATRGDHWEISEKQARQVAEPAARCLTYLPVADIPEPLQAGGALLIALAVVFGPAAREEWTMIQAERAAQAPTAPAAQQTTQGGGTTSNATAIYEIDN
jgi:hypothetical protein